MFSKRLSWPPRENALAALLREKRAAGVPIVDLTESNPTRAGIAADPVALRDALADPLAARYEPDPRGFRSAREAIAATRKGADPDRMILTASTSEAYAFLFKALCDPGDAVLVPAPSYPLFDYLAALEGVEVIPYALSLEERFRVDPDAIAAGLRRAGRRARAVVVVNPNNPTGTALGVVEREAIDRHCAAHGAALISDEVFLDYLWDRAPLITAPGSFHVYSPEALTFTLGGLSKGSALPQVKLGWTLVDGPARERTEALERLELIADTYLSVGTPVQRAAPRLLELGGMLRVQVQARLLANLNQLRNALPPQSHCRFLPADGGWSAVIQVPALRSEEDLVLGLLRYHDLLVHPGYFFDFPREAFVVVSLLAESGPLAGGVARLVHAASRPWTVH